MPSTYRIDVWKTNDSMEVPPADIAKVIEKLAESELNTAIFANRYDGIDLPDSACRVLVVDDLPQEYRLAKLLEATARRESPILRKQVAQRIEQGMGRGVRSSADYCVVILTGRNLVSFMADVKNERFFTEETKRQVELGKELATILKEQSTTTSYQAILDLVSQCLNRDDGWQQFHNERLQNIEISTSVLTETLALASRELRAWEYALKGQYDRASQEISDLLDECVGLSDDDRGWYLQLQAEYHYRVDQAAGLEKQLKAQTLNRNLLKPPGGTSYRKIQAKQTSQAFAVVDWLQQYSEPNALIARANAVLEGLSFGVSHELFEQSLDELAEIVGFVSQRPDKEIGHGPDVLWQMTADQYLVIEAKNQVEMYRPKIYKSEAQQIGHHVTWFQQEYSNQVCIPVLVHPAATLDDRAFVSEETRLVQPDDLERVVTAVRNFVTSLASRPSDQWSATDVAQQIATHSLRPSELINWWLAKRPN